MAAHSAPAEAVCLHAGEGSEGSEGGGHLRQQQPHSSSSTWGSKAFALMQTRAVGRVGAWASRQQQQQLGEKQSALKQMRAVRAVGRGYAWGSTDQQSDSWQQQQQQQLG
jgi:hypothetical protein